MWRIPLSDMNYDEREQQAVQQVLESGWLTMGPRVKQFEQEFAQLHGSAGAVAVANCTCALELVYKWLFETRPGKRVIIVPDVTFVATANAVISAGGTPLLCDIASPDVPYLSPAALEQLLASRDDVAGVVLVHYAGYDAGAEAISDICKKHDVALVEDCAHAPAGTTLSGKPLGTIGIAGCFSFFSNKNLATGEGGMIISDELSLLAWCSMLRSHGVTGGTWARHETKTANYNVIRPGHNYRCTEITAALGLVQLQKLEPGNRQRQALTRLYRQLLSDAPGVRVVAPGDEAIDHSDCHILPVVFDDVDVRGRAIEALAHASIQMSHHYRAIHTFAWYENQQELVPNPLPFAESFSSRQLTLPLHPGLKEEEVREICSTIREVTG